MSRALRSKGRLATKKAVLGAIDENITLDCGASSPSKENPGEGEKHGKPSLDLFDGSNEAHVLAYIADMEDGLERRKRQIMSDVEAACYQLDAIKRCAMLKLPKAVRQMTVGQFEKQYGVDLLAATEKLFGSVVSNQLSGSKRDILKGEGGRADEYGGSLRTPVSVGSCASLLKRTPMGVGVSLVHRTPATIRSRRKGEAIFSVNGSPMEEEESGDVVFSVKKSRKNSGEHNPSSTDIHFSVGEKRLTNMQEVMKLDTPAQKAAYEKLRGLSEDINGLMKQFPKWD